MTSVLLVAGTHGFGRRHASQWWEPGGAFYDFLDRSGFYMLGGDRPFTWSTSLDGLGWLIPRGRRHITWESAGINLDCYMRPPLGRLDYVPIAQRNIIAHSHGLQVVAYACSRGLKINRLITLGSPVRRDMEYIYRSARPNIGQWLHVHSDHSDRWQWLGTLFDGRIGIIREHPLADRNVKIARVGHTKLLEDVSSFALWHTRGLLNFLRARDVAA